MTDSSPTFQLGGNEISMAGFAVQAITFGRPFGPTSGSPPPEPAIWANLRVISVDRGGQLVDVSWVEKLDVVPTDPRVCGELVRAAVLKALEHEVDEQLRVNGVLLREPHPEVTYTVVPLSAEEMKQP